MALSSQVDTAARAVMQALDFQSSSESRQAAISYLESVKTGETTLLGTIGMSLIQQQSMSSEVRHYGFKMLQHLVRLRWEELNPEHRVQLAGVMVDLISEVAKPYEEWVLKSQTAALVAEVARRQGPSLWPGLLSKLFDISTASPAHAELVVMVLRWLPEDVTVHNMDLEGDRRKQLLMVLTQALPCILPFLYKTLEVHFGEAVRLLQLNNMAAARQHAAVVTATLNTLLAYVEWAPVNDMASSGLIEGCGFLLSSVDFRLLACEFLKQIASRRRPTDESASMFDSAITRVFEVLNGAVQSLSVTAEHENDLAYTACLCEAMVSLGSQHLQLVTNDHFPVYIQQMLGFLKHDRVAIHYPALLFWLMLLREMPSAYYMSGKDGLLRHDSTFNGGQVIPGQSEKGKKGRLPAISEEVYGTLLDIVFLWLLDKEMANDANEDELSSSGDYNNHRGRLLEVVRLLTVQCPVLAVSKISLKINEYWDNSVQHNLRLLEGTQRLLETIFLAVFDERNLSVTALPAELQAKVEGILKMLLTSKSTDPSLVEIHGRHLDAIGPYLRISPPSALHAVEKLFELLISLPIIPKGLGHDTLAVANSRARLQICTSFLRIAKSTDKELFPYVENIAKTVAQLQQQGQLLQAEHNLIAEAFLIISSTEGSQQQAEVLDWFFKPVRDKWGKSEWQDHFLSGPTSLVDLLSMKPLHSKPNEEMWSIFHTLTFFERVLKICAAQNFNYSQKVPPGIVSIESLTADHPIMAYLLCIIPPLLKLLRCLHCLWSPARRNLLPCEVQEALLLSKSEQATLVGEAISKPPRGVPFTMDRNASGIDHCEGRETEIRNWLRGVRDSGYSIIGLAAAHFSNSLFVHTDQTALKTALLENVEAMDFRHIRQLLHSVIIPIVKACPYTCWELWTGSLLAEVLMHCEKVLSLSWANLIREGAVKSNLVSCGKGGVGLRNEVMEEKMLRDLTRETCSLLAVLANPAFNVGLPSAEQLLQQNQIELARTEIPFQLDSNCLMRFVIDHHSIAMASLSISNQALRWPDSEAVHKAVVFCGATVAFAIASNNIELQKFVAKDLFASVIESLTIESNASAQGELVNLFRIIYLPLSDNLEYPKQILRSLPSITSETLVAFDAALSKTSSAKEQKQLIKSLLLSAGGCQLRALISQKNATIITNVSNHAIGSYQMPPTNHEEEATIGLASMI